MSNVYYLTWIIKSVKLFYDIFRKIMRYKWRIKNKLLIMVSFIDEIA